MKTIPLVFIIVLVTDASEAERWAVPDPMVTPGAVNPAATIEILCTKTAYELRKPTPPSWAREFELSSYNIPMSNSANYVLDYLIPPSLGGANTLSNVWPQPSADVDKKAELETRLRLRVCASFNKGRSQEAAEILTNVQRYLVEDWTEAYAVYVTH